MMKTPIIRDNRKVRVFDAGHESFGLCLYTTAKLLQSFMEGDARHLTGIDPDLVDHWTTWGAVPLSKIGPTGLTVADRLKGGLKVIHKRVPGIENAGLQSISGEKLIIYLYCLSIEFYLKSSISTPPRGHDLEQLAEHAKEEGAHIEAHESIVDLWKEHGSLLNQIRYCEDAKFSNSLLTQIERVSARLYETGEASPDR